MSKRIGILTSGGDCPGLNAIIRAVVKCSSQKGWDVYGIPYGTQGFLRLANGNCHSQDFELREHCYDLPGLLHARAYRELSLLLRRPPGREAFPGDIFYIHSRLLERATHLRPEFGGGSLTALPIVETEAQNISAYIPTNLVSITDGQIYLTPKLFHKGILPAVDVGKSVSRVGGKTQLPAYRAVSGDLRLSYSQFEELEAFSRFGSRLDEATQKSLERGQRIREVLQQNQYQPIPVSEQIAVLLAVTNGIFDAVPLDKIRLGERALCETVSEKLPDICQKIAVGEKLSESDRHILLNIAAEITSNKMIY